MFLRDDQCAFKAAVYAVTSALLLSASSLVAAADERATAVFTPAGANGTVEATSTPGPSGRVLPAGVIVSGDTMTMAPVPDGEPMSRKQRATAVIRNGKVTMDPTVDREALQSDELGDETSSDDETIPDDETILDDGIVIEASSRQGGRELDCLARAVYFEARGESARGQEAVAQVVLARKRTPGRPNSICGVVYEGSHRSTGCQFSFTCDRVADKIRDKAAWSRAVVIAARVMRGKLKAVAHGATFYHANYVRPYWASSMVKVATIGTHVFYRP